MAKTSRTVVNSGPDNVILPDLNPRDADTKYTGAEPLFANQPVSEKRAAALVIAFNWYSRYYDRKMAKEQLALYVETYAQENKYAPTLARQLRRVEDREIMNTYGWLARLALRGLMLESVEKQRLDAEISRLVTTLDKAEVVAPVEEVRPAKPNVQEIMRERAREAAGDLEGQLDEFIFAGARAAEINTNSVGILSERNVLPQHISILSEVWSRKLSEFQAVLEGRDSQLVEAYSHYSRHQIKAVIKFCEAVLAGFDSYINVKKAARTPRKRKPVSLEKQVGKFKFQKKFDELKLVSVHPGKIVGATEVWAYDTAKRKLWYLVADSHVGALGVKGTTILGFDASKSGVKTVRKPADVIKKLMAAGKPASRKMFGDIAAVHAQPNGRSNENLIILKVY